MADKDIEKTKMTSMVVDRDIERTRKINHDFWYSEYHMNDVRMSYRIAEIVYTERTPFQDIRIIKNDTYGMILIIDGYVQITEKDEHVYHEMICHTPMAVNPEIKNVLVIGGGDGGTVRELSEYTGLETIDMVEIDEAVVRACEKYIPQTAATLSNEPRLNLRFEDGLTFVKNAKDGAYDLILVDSTDPEGPGEALFTLDFYKDCFRILGDDGILINQHESAFYDIEREEMIKAHNKINAIFPIAKVYGFNIASYASGYWYFGFASKKYDPIADHKPDEWDDMGLSTKYYNSEIHRASFAHPNYLKELLEGTNQSFSSP